MSIITQCPACGTTFRVTPPQLQAQHGMVRCGRCAQIFDGFKTLATQPDTAPSEATPQGVPRDSAPVAEVATPVSVEAVTSSKAASAHAPQKVARDSPPIAEVPTPVPVEPAPSAAIDTPSARQDTTVAASRALVHETAAAPPAFMQSAFDAPASRRRSGGWTVGVLLMLVGLAAQGAYFYRSDIAANLPETRPHLAKMCELLRCTVALPQRPRQLSIEASDMQATDTANPGVIALIATLRNNATATLGYPALDVVLTDIKEHTVARRIFLPAEYLAAGKDLGAGIAPNAEITIRLDLDTGDLGAAGFRLDLIAAPAR